MEIIKLLKNKKVITEKTNAIDYNSPSNYNLIKNELKKSCLNKKIKITIFIFLFVFYESLTYLFKNNISMFNISITPFIYLITSASILLLSFICSLNFFSSKIKPFKYSFGTKLTIAFSSLAIFSRIVLLILFPCNLYKSTDLFIGMLILSLIFDSFNEFLIEKRILKNLKFVQSRNKKYSAKVYNKNSIPTNILKNISTTKPFMIGKTKVNRIINFIKNSYKTESFVKHINIFSILLILAVSAFSTINFLVYKNLLYALNELCTLLLLCYPFSFLTSLNISLYSSCKKALRKGILITNEASINEFSKVNVSVIDASSLYPAQNVILKEIKTFRGQRIDEAILYAATLASTKDGTLNKVFNRIILGQKKILEKVSNVTYEDKLGMSGWINGQKIIIGNRDILKKNKIDPPSRDYENKYTKQNEGLLYIAVGKELVAMFILEYKPNKKLKTELFKSIKSGIEILIRTSDTNITKERIALDFGVPSNLVKILPYDENMVFNNESEPLDYAEASLVLTEGYDSLLQAAVLCKKTSINFKLIYALQIISVILSILIGFSLAFNSSIEQINEFSIIMYFLFWFVISLIGIKLK